MVKMYFIELIFFDFSDLQIWTGKKKKNHDEWVYTTLNMVY